LLAFIAFILSLAFPKNKKLIVILTSIPLWLILYPFALRYILNLLPVCDEFAGMIQTRPLQRCECAGLKIDYDTLTLGLLYVYDVGSVNHCVGVITGTSFIPTTFDASGLYGTD
jgi:hypothetical protein